MEFQSKYIIKDDWLTLVLKCPSFRLIMEGDSMQCLKNKKDRESEYFTCLLNSTVFLFSKVQTGKIDQIDFLEENNFHLIDTNIVFEKDIEGGFKDPKDYDIRFALADDELQTVDLAGRSFLYSRFHLDGKFKKKQADILKGEWAGNFFKKKRGDSMVVAVSKGKVIGFLQLIYDMPRATLVIDLIGVDSKYRRRGVASGMISFAETYCNGFKRIQVGTQLANMPSLRFYQDIGYKISSSYYVFHYHNLVESKKGHE